MARYDQLRKRLKLRDLHAFLKVVELEGVGKAARELGASQPAISKAIADLERVIGVRLLDRSRRGVAPTPFGLALGRRGIAIFDELRQGISEIEFLSDPTHGEIRIGATEPLAAGPIAAAIDRLSTRNPGFTFQIINGDAAMLLRLLEDRAVDLVVARVYEPLATNHILTEILYRDTLLIVAGSNNHWLRRRKVDLAELVDEPWTLPPKSTLFGESVDQAFRAQGLQTPHAVVVTHSLSLRNRLLANGRFLTMDAAVPFRLSAKHFELKALPIGLPSTKRPVAVLTLKDRTPSPLLKIFIEALRSVARTVMP